MSERIRCAIVGTGGRAVTYIDSLCGEFRETAELVGFCDISQTRMNFYNRRLFDKFGLTPIPTYLAADFDRMIADTKPTFVLVTTVDSTHHSYVIRAMQLGCDVICEKPMTTDADKAKRILDAVATTGRKLRVTFNYRYTVPSMKMKELMLAKTIGTPTAVDFSWMLDTSHGADYFRRWHREKDRSGGMQIHKATHHFDGINWWIDSRPKTVYALGGLKFYGRENAIKRGESDCTAYSRYTGNEAARDDPFRLMLDEDPNLQGLYQDAEKDSGYIRDRNVFGGPITVEDTLAVTACYRNGVILNYSLVCYSPWEGYRVAITGTKGRIELYARHGSHIIAGQGDDELAAAQSKGQEYKLTVFPMFGRPYDVPIEARTDGGHGGADRLVLKDALSSQPLNDPLGRAATHIDGAASLLMGICINESLETGQAVQCDDVLTL